MNIVGLIPSRAGSKGIPRKSHVRLRGRPLIVHTFQAARAAKNLSRVILSTDDKKTIALGKRYGIEAPFVRPRALSTDTSRMIDVIRHAVSYLQDVEKYPVDAVVLLQPTSPLRRARHIDQAVTLFLKSRADTVVSVVKLPHQYNPMSVMVLENGLLKPFRKGPMVLRRQDKPRCFARNGPAILIVKRATLKRGGLYGQRVVPYRMSMEDSVDIDSPTDLALADYYFKSKR